MTTSRKVAFNLVVFLCIAFSGYGVFALIETEKIPLVAENLKNVDFQLKPWVYLLYTHIASSMFCLLVGPFQFLPKVIANKPLHRTLGMIYVLSILFGGGSGLILAFYATGGLLAKTGFGTLAVLWLFTTFMAMKKIRDRQIQEHKQWMYRSFALSFGAVSFRFWIPVLLILTKGDFLTAYPIAAWLAWVPNLILMELWLRRRNNKPSTPNVTPSVR